MVCRRETHQTLTHAKRNGEEERYVQSRERKETDRMPKEMQWMPVAIQGNIVYVITYTQFKRSTHRWSSFIALDTNLCKKPNYL